LREEETLRVSSGCLVGFYDGVDFDVQMLKDVKNIIFGGEGLFVTKLKYWWQILHRGCGFLTFRRVMRLSHEGYTGERL